MPDIQVQRELFDIKALPRHRSAKQRRRSGSFTDNMKLPVHRWFRYSAGFSGEWAENVIRHQNCETPGIVFDPFSGSGTTLIAAQRARVASVGNENHQFVHRVAGAKLKWSESEEELLQASVDLLKRAEAMQAARPISESDLMRRCYTSEALCRLEALKQAYYEISTTEGIKELIWLALTSILRECSGVGTAQWQYVLPNKVKLRVLNPFVAFISKVKMFSADMAEMKATLGKPHGTQNFCSDARDVDDLSHLNGRVSLVLTSPPYPNNYDYADATRLEMTFWDEIDSWSDLQAFVRHRLIRSCSQHSAAEKLRLPDLLEDEAIRPIRNELHAVCSSLAEVRKTKGGKKTYHTMVAAYFVDLAKVWQSLRPLCMDGAEVCFVIGDSAPYGVYVPVDRWLGQLAIAAGFRNYSFEKVRDRNTKWKNRKHRVLLKEGNLRVQV